MGKNLPRVPLRGHIMNGDNDFYPIQNREIDHAEIRLRINDSSAIKTLISSLNSKNEKEIEYALDILGTVRHKGLNESLARLLKHPRTQIRKRR